LKLQERFDTQFLIIGAGPSGEAAANRLTDLGGKVTIVEREFIGGTCVNKGCIPIHFALRNLLLRQQLLETNERHQLFAPVPDVDFRALQSEIKKVIGHFRQGILKNFDTRGIKLLKGTAKVINENTVEITGDEGKKTCVTAQTIIISTGTVFYDLQVPGLKTVKEQSINADDVLVKNFNELPNSVAIYGLDSPAVELSYFFHLLGSQVHLLSPEKNITGFESPELESFIEDRLDFQGIEVIKDVQLESLSKKGKGISISYETNIKPDQQLITEFFVNAYNRKANLTMLGSSTIKVKDDKPFLVDEYKSSDHIFFIGDVRGVLPYRTHKSSLEGLLIAEKLLGDKNLSFNQSLLPRVMNLDVQIATIGVTRKQARVEALKVIKLSLISNAEARILGQVDGHVFIFVQGDTGRIRGGEVVAPKASDLIAIIGAVMASDGTIADLKKIPGYHPSLSEAVINCAWKIA
jgi:dihydrolipoamide dehydrogenase